MLNSLYGDVYCLFLRMSTIYFSSLCHPKKFRYSLGSFPQSSDFDAKVNVNILSILFLDRSQDVDRLMPFSALWLSLLIIIDFIQAVFI